MPPYLREAKTCVNQRCFVKSKAANTEHPSCGAGLEPLRRIQGGIQGQRPQNNYRHK